MRFSTVVAFALPVLLVYAETFEVDVGGADGLVFNPTSVTAAVGDLINFTFTRGSHAVTRSTFDAPCEALTGADAADTGIRPVGESFQFNVTDVSAPSWWYCAPHCAGGMVFAVNPSAERTFAAFQAIARGESASAPAASESSTALSPSPSTSEAPASSAVKTGACSALAFAAVGVVSCLIF